MSSWSGASILALLLGLTACGGTVVEGAEDDASTGSTGGVADVPSDCVGAYDGNFGGDIRGSLMGNLKANADFEVTFVQSGNDQSFTGSGSVAEDGKIEVVLGPNSVTGRFNFARCRANGNWVAGEARGSWNATLQ
ncbi:MAG TPA: hypothetical protein VI197_33305 [Polyangiaceae bacterium]